MGLKDERPNEEEHICHAVELNNIHNGGVQKTWKHRDKQYYALPELYFDNFWDKVRDKIGIIGRLHKKFNEKEHIERAIEINATSTASKSWKNRGKGYYYSPQTVFGEDFWQKVREAIKEKENE